MTRYDPTRHRRRSIRLRGYDYANPGVYYVTICVHDRACLLGDITRDGHVRLSDAGQLVVDTWRGLPRYYAHLRLDAFVVMPNHVHAVIVLVGDGVNGGMDDDARRGGAARGMDDARRGGAARGMVGAGLRPAPTAVSVPPAGPAIPTRHAPTNGPDGPIAPCGDSMAGAAPHARPVASAHGDPHARAPLSEIVRAFKSFSARAINAHRGTPGVPVWQRNYYEHIVRTPDALARIRRYIDDNPRRWAHDALHPSSMPRRAHPDPR